MTTGLIMQLPSMQNRTVVCASRQSTLEVCTVYLAAEDSTLVESRRQAVELVQEIDRGMNL